MEGFKRIEFEWDKIVDYCSRVKIPLFVDYKKKNIYTNIRDRREYHYFDWVYVREDEQDLEYPKEIRIIDIMSGRVCLLTKNGLFGEFKLEGVDDSDY